MAEQETGNCDYCGDIADASVSECNWLSCTFKGCDGVLIHQECLHSFLRANRLEKNRKTGFKCPRGCGKGTAFSAPCPGRIDKSHPIIPRNEEKLKKRTQLAAAEPTPKPTKADKVQEAKAAKEAAKAKAAKPEEPAKPQPVGTIKINGKALPVTLPVPTAQPAASTSKPAASTKKDKNQLPDKQQLLAAAAAAKKELGLLGGSTQQTAASSGASTSREVSSLLASKATGPSTSVWGTKPSTPEPEAMPGGMSTLGHLPVLQQLLSAAEKRKMGTRAAALQPAPAVNSQALGASTSASTSTAAPPAIMSTEHFPPVSAMAGTSKAPPGPTPSEQLAFAQKLKDAQQAAAQEQQARLVAEQARLAEQARAAAEARLQAEQQQRAAQAAAAAQAEQQQRAAQAAAAAAAQAQAAAAQAMLHSHELANGGQEEEEGSDTDSLPSGARLTKAQRKNLKRAAGKKKKAAEGGSGAAGGDGDGGHGSGDGPQEVASPSGQPSPAQSDSGEAHQAADAEWEQALQDLSVQALVTFRARGCAGQLQRLGFAPWQALCAIRACGMNLEGGVAWLVERMGDYPQHVVSEAESMALPVIDITPELTQLADAHAALHLPAQTVHQAVIRAQGDVRAALSTLAGGSGLQLNGPPGYANGPAGPPGFSGLAAMPSAQLSERESFYSARSDLLSFASGEVSEWALPRASFGTDSAAPTPSGARSPWPVSNQQLSGWRMRGASAAGEGTDSGPNSAMGAALGGAAAASAVAGSSRLSGWMRGDEVSQPSTSRGGTWANGNGHGEHTWESLSGSYDAEVS